MKFFVLNTARKIMVRYSAVEWVLGRRGGTPWVGLRKNINKSADGSEWPDFMNLSLCQLFKPIFRSLNVPSAYLTN